MGGHVENVGPPNLSQFLIKVVTDEYPESQEALFRQFDIEDTTIPSRTLIVKDFYHIES